MLNQDDLTLASPSTSPSENAESAVSDSRFHGSADYSRNELIFAQFSAVLNPDPAFWVRCDRFTRAEIASGRFKGVYREMRAVRRVTGIAGKRGLQIGNEW